VKLNKHMREKDAMWSVLTFRGGKNIVRERVFGNQKREGDKLWFLKRLFELTNLFPIERARVPVIH